MMLSVPSLNCSVTFTNNVHDRILAEKLATGTHSYPTENRQEVCCTVISIPFLSMTKLTVSPWSHFSSVLGRASGPECKGEIWGSDPRFTQKPIGWSLIQVSTMLSKTVKNEWLNCTGTPYHHTFKGDSQQGGIGNHTTPWSNAICVLSFQSSLVQEYDIQYLGITSREDATHPGNGRYCLLVLILGEAWWGMPEAYQWNLSWTLQVKKRRHHLCKAMNTQKVRIWTAR